MSGVSIKEVFLQAVDMTADARADYLKRACVGNDEVQRRVEALIVAHERPESLLDQAAVRHEPGDNGDPTVDHPIAEEPGTIIVSHTCPFLSIPLPDLCGGIVPPC